MGSWSGNAQPVLLVALGVALTVGLAVLVLRWAPGWLAPSHDLSPGQRAEEVGRVRTALLAMLAGAVAIVGVVYTVKTFRLNLQGQLTDRFTRAIDQLGSPQIDVRLGGIYALSRIAGESAADHEPIMEILAGYLREHAPRLPPHVAAPQSRAPESGREQQRPGDATRPVRELTSPTDVQAALSVIARHTHSDDRTRPFDLASVDLRGCDFHGAALAGVDLSLADLSGARLAGVDLTAANLSEANLAGAILTHANLADADLSGATLTEAMLADSVLNGAVLAGCDLAAADLTSAYLASADLSEADLTGATLIADLSGADLTDSILEEITLEGSVYTPDTRWPEDFSPLEHGAAVYPGMD